jgi:hypothetical protein
MATAVVANDVHGHGGAGGVPPVGGDSCNIFPGCVAGGEVNLGDLARRVRVLSAAGHRLTMSGKGATSYGAMRGARHRHRLECASRTASLTASAPAKGLASRKRKIVHQPCPVRLTFTTSVALAAGVWHNACAGDETALAVLTARTCTISSCDAAQQHCHELDLARGVTQKNQLSSDIQGQLKDLFGAGMDAATSLVAAVRVSVPIPVYSVVCLPPPPTAMLVTTPRRPRTCCCTVVPSATDTPRLHDVPCKIHPPTDSLRH